MKEEDTKTKNKSIRAALKEKAGQAKKDARATKAAKAQAAAEEGTPPYEVLGMDGQNVVLYSRERRGIVMLPAARLSADALFMRVGPSHLYRTWKSEWAELNDKQLTQAVRDDIAEKVGSKVYNPGKVRGAGIWPDPEGIIYSIGRECYLMKTGETEIQPVYPLRPDGTLYAAELGVADMMAPAEQPLTDEEGEAIYRFIAARAWVEPHAADMVAGWLVCSQLGGVLPVRPHLWINGARGSGKTELRKDLQALIGSSCRTLAGAESTTAGLRRLVEGTALPVLYDETETDGQDYKVKRMQSMLSLARLSFDGDQASPRAKEGGGVQMTRLTRCFCLFSIRDFLESEADYNRFHRLHLQQLPPAGVADLRERQRDGRELLGRKDTPARLVTRLIQQAEFVIRNIGLLSERLEAAGIEGRRAKINAALLAGKWALTHSGEVTEEYIINCAHVAESAEKQARSDSRPEWEELLDTIMSYPCIKYPMKMNVCQAVRAIFWPDARLNLSYVNDLNAQLVSALGSLGIHVGTVDKRRKDERSGLKQVVIEHNSQAFRNVIAKSKWTGAHGIPSAIKGAPHAEVRVGYLNGRNTTRLYIYEDAFVDAPEYDE